MVNVHIILEDTPQGVSSKFVSNRAFPDDFKQWTQAEVVAYEIAGLLERTIPVATEVPQVDGSGLILT